MSRLIREEDVVKHVMHAGDVAKQDPDLQVVGLGYVYSAPTAKIHLITCVDCKYGELDIQEQGYLEPPTCEGIICLKHNGIHMGFDDFCSYGERRGGEQK